MNYRNLFIVGLLVVLMTLGFSAPVSANTTLIVDDDSVECLTAVYATIQSAVDAAQPGDTILVCAGTYEEQVTINKDLTLVGNGNPTIMSPVILATSFGDKKAVVTVEGANVSISGITVDGAGRGNANYKFIGIAYHNAGGSVEGTTIVNVMDTPFSGAQHGVALYAYNQDGTPRSLTITGNTINTYQKNGMALIGPNLTVDVQNNTVTGAGPTNVTAQNGIQVQDASGQVRDNNVSGNYYTGPTWTASGYLVFADGIAVKHNVGNGNQTDIYVYANDAKVQQHTAAGSYWGVILFGDTSKMVNNSLTVNGDDSIGVYVYGNNNKVTNTTATCTGVNTTGVAVEGTGNSVVSTTTNCTIPVDADPDQNKVRATHEFAN